VTRVFLPTPVPPVARSLTYDPRTAAAEALRDYIASLTFLRAGGTAPDTSFQLREVHEEWPEPSERLNYPAAAITDATPTPMGAHNFTPTPLEETRHIYGENTVVWKLAEAQIDFQVDFFTDDAPSRTAIAAALPQAFSPANDERTGVVLCGPARYLCFPVRASLVNYRRMDTEATVFPRERRLMAIVRCEVDVISLRCDTPLDPFVRVTAIGPDVDPGIEPQAPLPPNC